MRLVSLLLALVACDPGPKEPAGPADTDADTGCDAPATWFADRDGDGVGDDGDATSACEAPPGHVAIGGDCDDGDAGILPGADDACDGVDQDCDGEVDEDATWADWYADADGDGFGDPGDAAQACEPPPGRVADGTDCDDADSDAFPGAAEVCDGDDEDCDGTVDEADALDVRAWYADADGDGFGDAAARVEACDAPAGHVADATDCDDALAAAHPGATETCGGADEDCDGAVDEDDAADAPTWYADADGDGFGDASTGAPACAAPAGTVADDTDCDDTDPATHPGGVEVCGGADEDCDGVVDEDDAADAPTWYADVDGDGYGDAAAPATMCVARAGWTADATDCDDALVAVNPAAVEVCNGLDDDCEGSVDEGAADAPTWYADVDGDGYGDAAAALEACAAPAGYGADGADCDDTDAGVSPAGTETCDGEDDDCDGSVDEGTGYTWYVDADLDGEGAGAPLVGCTATPDPGYATSASDCDDADAYVHTGATELCDGQRNDCSDRAWTTAYEAALVSYETPAGEWTDETAAWAGTSVQEIELPTEGTVHVCPATWYVRAVAPSGADVTLSGRYGAATTTLWAAYTGSVVRMEDDTVSLVVEGLELERGYAHTGGGIHNPGGVLTVRETTFSSMYFQAGPGPSGAGIWSGGGTLVVEDSVVAGLVGSTSDTRGGGIYAEDAWVTVTGSELDGSAGWGAALYWTATNGATLTVEDTVFDTCHAQVDGGCVYVDASGTGAVSIVDSEFHDSNATENGGGIYLTGGGTGTVTVSGCTFDNVSADDDGGAVYHGTTAPTVLTDLYVTNGEAAYGAGVFFATDGAVSDSTFYLNGNVYATVPSTYGTIYVDGGADATLTDVVLDDNYLKRRGAAAYVESGGTLTCERCTITDNWVDASSTCNNSTLTTTYCGGGAIWAEGDVTLVDSVVSGNEVQSAGNFGGGVYLKGAALVLDGTEISGNRAGSGGGVFAYGPTTAASVTLTNGATIADNDATSDGGGVYLGGATLTCDDPDGLGSGITGNVGGGIVYATGTNSVSVTACDLGDPGSDDNTSASGSAGSDVWVSGVGWYSYGAGATFTCDATACH